MRVRHTRICIFFFGPKWSQKGWVWRDMEDKSMEGSLVHTHRYTCIRVYVHRYAYMYMYVHVFCQADYLVVAIMDSWYMGSDRFWLYWYVCQWISWMFLSLVGHSFESGLLIYWWVCWESLLWRFNENCIVFFPSFFCWTYKSLMVVLM